MRAGCKEVWEGGIIMAHTLTFLGDRYVHYINCADYFTDVHVKTHVQLYTSAVYCISISLSKAVLKIITDYIADSRQTNLKI